MTGRTIAGLAIPFNQVTVIAEDGRRFEEFVTIGAFAGQDRMTVSMVCGHAGRQIGTATIAADDTAGLLFQAQLDESHEASLVLLGLENRAAPVSIRMVNIVDEWTAAGDRRAIIKARIEHIAILAEAPAYESACAWIPGLAPANFGAVDFAIRQIFAHAKSALPMVSGRRAAPTVDISAATAIWNAMQSDQRARQARSRKSIEAAAARIVAATGCRPYWAQVREMDLSAMKNGPIGWPVGMLKIWK